MSAFKKLCQIGMKEILWGCEVPTDALVKSRRSMIENLPLEIIGAICNRRILVYVKALYILWSTRSRAAENCLSMLYRNKAKS